MERKFFGFFLLVLFLTSAKAQIKSRLNTKIVAVKDSILVDSLSILPQTFKIYLGDELLDTSTYKIDFANSLLTWKKKPLADFVQLSYRTFPVLLTEKSFHKDRSLIGLEAMGKSFVYQPPAQENTLFNFQGIEKSGSISRSIGFGNNQDLSVNSNMALQFAGKIGQDIEISAVISDDNIPIQPDGNTQQINDFDKVFIQLKRDGAKLIAGDYELNRPDSYFMNYFKRTQGAYISNTFKDKNNLTYHTQAAAAVSKGRSARNQFIGEEGNQGSYRLIGNNGEQYIIVLSGTERVFIDGELLIRGQDNDYVMDYNTAEITFTTKRLITRNSRISVEFEYSDKIYGRSLYFINQDFKSEKLKVGFNLYTEQDNPNRPILQNLTAEQHNFLKGIGNNIDQALYPNADSVAFNENEILYKKVDSLGNQIYVYSTDPKQAKYRVGFSYVGKNNGSYVLDVNSVANGRVYRFVASLSGQKQGDYEPVTLLITPKKQQLAMVNAEYKISKKSRLFTELGISNNDVNLYSDIDNNQNQGIGYKLIYNQQNRLQGTDSTGLKLNTQISYEFADAKFKPIERFRPVEFDRDFNINGLKLGESDEHWTTLSLQLFKDDFKQVAYRVSSFVRPEDYKGIQQSVNGKYRYKGFGLNYRGSLLKSDIDSLSGDFLKQDILFSKLFKPFEIGVNYQQEINKTLDITTDKLSLQSFSFNQVDYFLKSLPSHQKTAFQFNYITRTDRVPFEDRLQEFSKAKTYNAKLELNKQGKSPFSITATYRTIDYEQADSLNKNAETLLSRIDYNLNTFKGFLNLNSFYELGTGQEPKREYIYLEVPAGQGAYTWNDYNGNGIKELNEFEIARFSDEAKYIRIFRSTNEFIRSNFSNINQTLKLTPAILLKHNRGFGAFVAKFSSISVLRIEKKILASEGGLVLNPYKTSIDAVSLVSLTSFLRNSIFFNRMNPNWGIDFNLQNNGSKSLLTGGFDSRDLNEQSIRFRWNFVRKTNFLIELKSGSKNYRSELFADKNYDVDYREVRPELGYQFSADFKLTFNGTYRHQANAGNLGGETVDNLSLGSEARYNVLKKGTLTSKLNFIGNNFSGKNNTPIAYELLDGLQSGNNMTWQLGFQRIISNGIQLNFNYEGRKSEKVKTIHTGGVQVRAYF
ncbi:hypothetical protein Pedsa_2881 [Pseudopedobacter saltans DSM 12145]|uniref:Uncharacterized protein n=1 Tax=Pseudopedobacter saltans (strain ATCC 51119 / DSM 12145 / JCM 21818 / CCUG 39354 / LMG 10337 / NBRC 100064 / NCIMB 13643) TaxID=762903 RepID=F0S8F6_PSESL|nr:hypothetical protein [Pseudopedobacter saltans]ADY53420.1 hypothetical protein Pedsa_2881 [Pseudopedobacter saltans DSM 12145]